MIMRRNPKVVGIYRLIIKTNLNNFRAVQHKCIIERLKKQNVEIVIFEPTLKADTFNECKVLKDFAEFKNITDVVLVNRMDENVKEIQDKVYTRDLFSRD